METTLSKVEKVLINVIEKGLYFVNLFGFVGFAGAAWFAWSIRR